MRLKLSLGSPPRIDERSAANTVVVSSDPTHRRATKVIALRIFPPCSGHAVSTIAKHRHYDFRLPADAYLSKTASLSAVRRVRSQPPVAVSCSRPKCGQPCAQGRSHLRSEP